MSRGWAAGGEAVTTLVLLRHGATAHTAEKRFSGGLASANPGLSETGRLQVSAAAEWLAQRDIDAVVSSPVRRASESAALACARWGLTWTEEPDLAEMEFGDWDGLTFSEVGERHPEQLRSWLGSVEVAPPGGESFRDVERRVEAGLGRVLAEHHGRTVVAVSHVTPIKIVVAHALGAPLDALYRMELAPASVCVVAYYGDPTSSRASLRAFNHLPGPGPAW